MSGAMRRILAFMLMLILLLARNAHAEEWESLFQELAREIAEEKNNADYGAADLLEKRVTDKGSFRFWNVEKKNWYGGLLPCQLKTLERMLCFD